MGKIIGDMSITFFSEAFLKMEWMSENTSTDCLTILHTLILKPLSPPSVFFGICFKTETLSSFQSPHTIQGHTNVQQQIIIYNILKECGKSHCFVDILDVIPNNPTKCITTSTKEVRKWDCCTFAHSRFDDTSYQHRPRLNVPSTVQGRFKDTVQHSAKRNKRFCRGPRRFNHLINAMQSFFFR